MLFSSIKHIAILQIITVSFWVGCISFFSWYYHPLFYFACFIPFFVFFEHRKLKTVTKTVAWFSMLLCWNFSVTYWLCEVNFLYGLGAIVANSLLMLLIILLLYIISAKFIIKQLRFLFYLFGWLLFEYAHHFWDLSWTWLTIGNVFGNAAYMVQWYEYTGVLGGTVWVLIINFFLYKSFFASFTRKRAVTLISIFILPIIVSIILLQIDRKTQNDLKVVLTRTEFPIGNTTADMQRIQTVSKLNVSYTNYDLLLLPELFLNEPVWYTGNTGASIKNKFGLLLKGTKNIISGAILYKENQNNGLHSVAGSYSINYDTYNSALLVSDSSEKVKLKVKKKYVPVEEFVPGLMRWMAFKSENYSKINTPETFKLSQGDVFISLCYESVNSFFVSNNIGNSKAIMMLASEAFFKNSKAGKSQYASICLLRSIENRKEIGKSSNCGSTFYCNYKGDLKYYQSGKVNITKKVSISLFKSKTLYNYISKYIGYIFLCVFISILLYSNVAYLKAIFNK